MTAIEVQCRCGSSRLRISGPPVAQIYCHCDDCQAAHDAAYVAASIYPAPTVESLGEKPIAMRVKATPRMRCATCNTYLFAELAAIGLRSVNAFLLPEGEFKPQLHAQCQHAVLPIMDGLPHFKGFPSAFGGTDELVGW